MLQDETLLKIAEKYGKTTAQIDLRFLIQSGVVAIPKSVHEKRVEENFDIFDFTILSEDMKPI